MPKSWYCIPSARPVAEVAPVVAKWKAMGYGVALQRDESACSPADSLGLRCADAVFWRSYAGYADAVNFLSRQVLSRSEVDWIVCGGDDTYPDPNKTGDEIAAECTAYFGLKAIQHALSSDEEFSKGCPSPTICTFGVMQPTGDRWNDGLGVIIDRIAGSPWLGRSWCERANGGRGPLWPEYEHCFVDEELQEVAIKLGVFLQRQDLTHFHDHPQRKPDGKPAAHMAKWSGQQHWRESSTLFKTRKAAGFPGHEPIA